MTTKEVKKNNETQSRYTTTTIQKKTTTKRHKTTQEMQNDQETQNMTPCSDKHNNHKEKQNGCKSRENKTAKHKATTQRGEQPKRVTSNSLLA